MELFRNSSPLVPGAGWKCADLDLAAFPAVDDFTLEIRNSAFRALVWYVSPTLGRLSHPALDHADARIRLWTLADIPMGTPEQPYSDADQGWETYIWRDGAFVYVMEGEGEGEFTVWYRVPADRYLSEWQRLIDAVKAAPTAFFSLEEALRHVDTARRLIMDRRNLARLDHRIGRLTNLRHLSLSFNLLDTLPATIGQLEELENLDVSFNRLTRLPAEIGRLKNLRHLNLADNELGSLPPEFAGLTGLRDLHLGFNQLRTMPDSLCAFTEMEYLELCSNPFGQSHPGLARLQRLRTLSLPRLENEEEVRRMLPHVHIRFQA